MFCKMFIPFLFISCFHLIISTNGLKLDESSLLKLLEVTESTADGFGFTEASRNHNLFSQFLQIPENDNFCPKKSNSDTIGRKQKLLDFSLYPKLRKIYSECRHNFKENQTCAATCIFYGIIQSTNYGKTFLEAIDTIKFSYYDRSKPYPHRVSYEFHLHENVFCFSNDYRSTLLNNIAFCKLPSDVEVCIIDEDELHCDPSKRNCNFDNKEVSVMTIQNSAHIVACANLDSVKWGYFANSTKLQCLVAKTQNNMMTMQRPVFNNCNVCAKENRTTEPVIEYLKLPSKEEFLKAVRLYQPIHIRNGANLEGMQPMNLSFIQQVYKNVNYSNKVDLGLCQSTPHDTTAVSLAVMAKEAMSNSTWYTHCLICHREVLDLFKVLIPKPSFLPDENPTSVNIPRLFVGTNAGGLDYHIDHVLQPTWQAQLHGDKIWFVRPPPECHQFCTKWFEFTVKEGDIIVMHINTWYHETIVPDSRISIGYAESFDFV